MISGKPRTHAGLSLLASVTLLWLIYGPALVWARSDDDMRPNILFLLIDDMGIGDVSAFAADDIETPNIDSLARTGVRFTHGYVTAPICSPSRTSAMLGMHSARFGHFGNSSRGLPVPEDVPALPLTLKRAGYATGMIGRMDIGSADQDPFSLGFDEIARRPSPLPVEERDPKAKPPWSNTHTGATYLGRDGSYWTEVNQGEFIDFIDRHAEEPFYLYYAPLAVHFPVEEVPQKYLDRVPDTVDPQRRHFAGTLLALDDTLGVLFDKLKAEGLYENTLIFFMGDNGGWVRDGGRNGPLRGGKVTPWEGGYRVPYMVSWPAKFKGGRVIEGLVSSLDVYPTAAAAAGAPLPPHLDGVNLLPALTGDPGRLANRTLYFRWFDSRTPYHDARVLRRGSWRLVMYRNPWDLYRDSPIGQRVELYNIDEDPGENHNLAPEQPARVRQLQADYVDWEKGISPIDYNPTYGAGMPMPRGQGWAHPQ